MVATMDLAATQQPGTSYAVLGALVVVAFLVRQGRRNSRTANLERGERMRPLLITCIDPLVSLLIIGPLLWRLLHVGPGNVVGALAGAAVGIVIGYYRARVMFVRAEKTTFSVVLKRSGVEYGLVFVLIVLRSIEGQLELGHASAATVAVAALASLGLVEAFVRSGLIIYRYVTHEVVPVPPTDAHVQPNDEVPPDSTGSGPPIPEA
jgi:hypothetical protein